MLTAAPPLRRCLLAEGAGTFALTLVAAGAEVIAVASGGEVGHAARVTAPGLMVLALIYALGDVSGAHVNPAVTLAFALRGVFSWARVPAYWLAQLAGAIGRPPSWASPSDRWRTWGPRFLVSASRRRWRWRWP